MFCENCGNKIANDDKFCGGCGSGVSRNEIVSQTVNSIEHNQKPKELENKSWFRLMKVIYTFFYFFLFIILYFVFTESSQTYNYSSYGSSSYTYDYGHGIWITFLTLLFSSAFLKLLKVSFFYVASGVKPNWQHETKKIFNPFY